MSRKACVFDVRVCIYLDTQAGGLSFLCELTFSTSSTEHIRTNFTLTPHHLQNTQNKNITNVFLWCYIDI